MRGYRNGFAVRDAADKASDAIGAALIDHDAGVAVHVGQPQCRHGLQVCSDAYKFLHPKAHQFGIVLLRRTQHAIALRLLNNH